jgi:hypothetical protein
MEWFVQFGNFRISLGILTSTIHLGVSLGYTVDEFSELHHSLNIGFIFVSLNFIMFNEETY